jgi:hypothetical protein
MASVDLDQEQLEKMRAHGSSARAFLKGMSSTTLKNLVTIAPAKE